MTCKCGKETVGKRCVDCQKAYMRDYMRRRRVNKGVNRSVNGVNKIDLGRERLIDKWVTFLQGLSDEECEALYVWVVSSPPFRAGIDASGKPDMEYLRKVAKGEFTKPKPKYTLKDFLDAHPGRSPYNQQD